MFGPKYQLLLLPYVMNFAPPCGGNCVDGGDVDGDVCANTQEKDDDEDEDGDVDINGWAHAQEKATLCQRMSSEAANITPSHDQRSHQYEKNKLSRVKALSLLSFKACLSSFVMFLII